MPDVEYRIVITNDTSYLQKKQAIASKSGDSTSGVSGSSSTSKNIRSSWGYIAYKRTMPFVKQVVQNQISLVEVRTGRQEQQMKLQFAYDTLSQVGGLAENILVGFLTGNAFGAAAAAVLTVAGQGISLMQKAEQLNLQQNLENISLGLMTARTGGIKTFSGNSR